MNALVIVDMQVAYAAAAHHTLVEAINTEARGLSDLGGHIILLNMDDSGRWTVSPPDGAGVLWKPEPDGGDIVYSYLLGAGLVHPDLRVTLCGVNLSQCVYRTAVTLAMRLANEHALCDHVAIALNLCGDGERFRVRFNT